LASISGFCENGDIAVISEKAVSVAMGLVVDESAFKPSLMAKVLARIWMRIVWGHLLGALCHLRTKTIWRLSRYPIPAGEFHKEITLRYAGFRQSLLHYSEGGIDVTNLPYALAALPLSNSDRVAAKLRTIIKERCGKDVVGMISDTDKTYSRNGIHITPRPHALRGIVSLGLFALILGRCFRWTQRATPVAVCGGSLNLDDALEVADKADRARGFGAGRTVWDMARAFHVGFMDVTWEMLDRVEHYPIVLVRKSEARADSGFIPGESG
jgi:F420-0:gamma-glutamyl ligase-like protein